MISILKAALEPQYVASLQMLINAVLACPDELWDTKEEYWYKAYHTLFFTDYYLSEPSTFLPPAPFDLSELDPSGLMPPRVYTKEEIITYAHYCIEKGKEVINNFDHDTLQNRFVNDYRDYPILEIFIYNLRHIPHHVGQLHLLLRQHGIEPLRWVSRG